MPIQDYIHHLSMYNNTEHYGMPEASKEGPSEAEGLRMRVDRPGTGTVDIDNKGRYRTGTVDTAKGITTTPISTGTGRPEGRDNTTQGLDGTTRSTDVEDRQWTTLRQHFIYTYTAGTQQSEQQQTISKTYTTTTTPHWEGDNWYDTNTATSHEQTATNVTRKGDNNVMHKVQIHRRTYRRAWRGKLWRTQQICTTIMDRTETGHALHTPSLPASYKAKYRGLQGKITTALYVRLIQRTVAGSNPRPGKRRPVHTTLGPKNKGLNKKTKKPYSTRSSYYRDEDGRLRR